MSGALEPSNRFHHAAAGASHFVAAAPDSAFLELTSDLAYDFGLGFHHHRHHQHQPPPGFGYHLSSTELAWEAPFTSYHHQGPHLGSHCDFGAFSLSTSRLHAGGNMGVQRQCPPRTSPCSVASSKTTKTRRRVATIAQRRAASIRERRRMFNLSSAFDKLRKKVPTFAYEKRLSRIETLRLAIMYIAFMTEVIRGGDPTYDAAPQIWTAAPQTSAPLSSDTPIQSRSDRLAHICSRHV